jgi:hypothetical protein
MFPGGIARLRRTPPQLKCNAIWRQGLSYPQWLDLEAKRVGCPMPTLASSA